MRKVLTAALSVFVCAALLFSTVSTAFDGTDRAPLQVGILSDIHYYAEKMTGNWCDAFMHYAENALSERYETPAILESALSALTAHAEENGMKYVFIPGDLTANGEYDAHVELAARLERFEEETGLSVIVTNGNHDINNFNGITFESGKKEAARITTPDEFREIYQNLGFDLAYHTYTPQNGRAGMLSYSVRLDGGYRLIVLDVNKYTADVTGNGTDSKETGGGITDGLMEWALAEIEDAKACGEAVIGMEHHSLVEHFKNHSSIFQLFVVDDWQERAEAFADAGLHYMVTGHMHDTSITDWVSDSGNVVYDISTSSLTGYPNLFREIKFDNADGLTADIQTYDVDCVTPVTVRGTEYARPFRDTFSFVHMFKTGIDDLAISFLDDILTDLFNAIETEGGLFGAIKKLYHVDVEEILSHYVDVRLGPIDIFTMRNVMSFLNDLDSQICDKVFSSREDVEALVRELVNSLMDFRVSDLPCTKYIDTLGFGDPGRPGTLQDVAYTLIATLFAGNQTLEDDAFMRDVLDNFRNRNAMEDLFNVLYDVLLNDILQDRLLGQLQFNIDTLFPTGTLGHISMTVLDECLSLVFHGDKSYTNVINSVLGLGLVPGMMSINGIADHLIEEYMTQSQFDGMGETLASMLEDMMTDHGDGEDLTRLLTDDPHPVEATRANWRLPSIVTVTTGTDAETTRSISWYTKFSVTGSDIEIVPYSANPSFSGSPTRGGVNATSERHDRFYPGADLGVLGFMDTKVPLVRHTVEVTGLNSGAKYSYRVGDAEKGWWSEPGVLDMADGSQNVTFLHVTDPQSQNAAQYERFHSVLKTAFSLYPDTDLVVSSGDQVDNGANVNQWQALADVSSDVLMSTVFMPTTGNHEKSDGALDQYFVLPNVPQQDRDGGVYYDYDYNNVHFMVLNTNDATSKDGLSETQLNWLQDSAKSSDAQWKIVVLHKAVYSNGSHYDDKEVVAMRKQFKRLFPQLGIDMVLEGHDHVYLRTGAMYSNLRTQSATKDASYGGRDYTMKVDPYGTFYVISGTAGVKNYMPKSAAETGLLFPPAEGTSSLQLPMFSAVQIRGNTLYFDAFAVQADGSAERIDSFAVEKSGEKKVVPAVSYESEDAMIATPDMLEDAMLVYAAVDGIPVNGNELESSTASMRQVAGSDSSGSESGSPSDAGQSGSSDSGASDSGSSGSNTPSGSSGASEDAAPPDSVDPGASGSGSSGYVFSGGSSNNRPASSNASPSGSADPFGSGSGSGSGASAPGADGSGDSGSDSSGGSGSTRFGLFSASGGSASGSGASGASGSGSDGSGASGSGSASNGSASSGSGAFGTRTFGTGQTIPKLGGSKPVATVTVMFCAMVFAMWARSRKERDEE